MLYSMVFHLWGMVQTLRVCIRHEVFLSHVDRNPRFLVRPSPTLWSMSSCNCQVICPQQYKFQAWWLQSSMPLFLFFFYCGKGWTLSALSLSKQLSLVHAIPHVCVCGAVQTKSRHVKKKFQSSLWWSSYINGMLRRQLCFFMADCVYYT